MSELLSQHVLQNYDKFVAGIDEVGKVERDLVAAYQVAKVSHLRGLQERMSCVTPLFYLHCYNLLGLHRKAAHADQGSLNEERMHSPAIAGRCSEKIDAHPQSSHALPQGARVTLALGCAHQSFFKEKSTLPAVSGKCCEMTDSQLKPCVPCRRARASRWRQALLTSAAQSW